MEFRIDPAEVARVWYPFSPFVSQVLTELEVAPEWGFTI